MANLLRFASSSFKMRSRLLIAPTEGLEEFDRSLSWENLRKNLPLKTAPQSGVLLSSCFDQKFVQQSSFRASLPPLTLASA